MFNFDFLRCPWDGPRSCGVDATLKSHARVGAAATWVLSNHDVIRNVTRYGRADTSFSLPGAHRRGHRPGPRHPPGPRRGAAVAVPARRGLHLPGRGTRPVGGRGHPRRAAAGPDVAALRPRPPGPGRLPRTAAVVRRPAAVRLPDRCRTAGYRTWLPQQAGWKHLTVHCRAERSRLDAVPVPARPSAAASRERP